MDALAPGGERSHLWQRLGDNTLGHEVATPRADILSYLEATPQVIALCYVSPTHAQPDNWLNSTVDSLLREPRSVPGSPLYWLIIDFPRLHLLRLLPKRPEIESGLYSPRIDDSETVTTRSKEPRDQANRDSARESRDRRQWFSDFAD